MNVLRSAIRLAHVVWCVASSLVEYARLRAMLGRELSYSERASWLQRCCRKTLLHLGVQTASQGTPPRRGVLICNHLSYMDILVLSSLTPCCFLSKAEVCRWPFFGLVARAAGTVFLNRKSPSALLLANQQLRRRLAQGVPVVLFPEGTTSDGSSVLPFHSSLFQAVEKSDFPLTPAYITYSLTGGSLSEDVCFWRDMTLLPHLARLFCKPTLRAYISFGSAERGFQTRKEAAEQMRAQVVALACSGVHQLAYELSPNKIEAPPCGPMTLERDPEVDVSV